MSRSIWQRNANVNAATAASSAISRLSNGRIQPHPVPPSLVPAVFFVGDDDDDDDKPTPRRQSWRIPALLFSRAAAAAAANCP